MIDTVIPQHSSTRSEILRQGLSLLSANGMSGVTIGALAEQVGMSKSGLYAHFKSKEGIQMALMEQAVALSNKHVVEPAMRAPDGLPRLRALIERWLGWTQKAGLPGGCPIAAAMFELDDIEGKMREKVAALEANWSCLLLDLTEQAIKLKHLRRDLDADQFVWELFGIYLAHHTSYRFKRDKRSDGRAKTALEALIARARLAPEIRERRG